MATAPQVSGWGFSAPDWGGYNILKKDEQSAYQKSLDAQTNLSNTAWQRGTADMKAAGINPMLAVSQGPASTPQVSKMHIPSPPGMGASAQMQTAAQVDLTNATSEKTKAEAAEIRERTPTHGMDRELKGHQMAEIRQKIGHSAMEIEEIIAKTEHYTASADNVKQQTQNLKAILPQIRETITQLKQHNAANMPEVQRQIANIEKLFRQMEMPGRQTDEAFADSSSGAILRSIGAALRALNPLLPSTSHTERR